MTARVLSVLFQILRQFKEGGAVVMDTKFAGVAMQLGGETYVVPPLNLRKYKELKPQFDVIKSEKTSEGLSDSYINAFGEIVCAALNRNYPEITVDRALELIDLSTMKSLYAAVMGVNGLVKSTGEAAPQV